jgi:ATP-dependent protease ClpP protease subunit
MPLAREALVSIHTRYAADRALIRVTGDLCTETLYRLGDELVLAAEHYQYDHIALAIDSRGGDSAATLLLLDRMRDLQATGVVIATEGLTVVASAAALVLAAGSIPHRSARPSTRLLLHSARLIAPGATVLTRETLAAQRLLLDEADAAAFGTLARHVHDHHLRSVGATEQLELRMVGEAGESRVTVQDSGHLADLYRAHAALDECITPEIARGLRLIDHILGDYDG